jgi:hypothetical protein
MLDFFWLLQGGACSCQWVIYKPFAEHPPRRSGQVWGVITLSSHGLIDAPRRVRVYTCLRCGGYSGKRRRSSVVKAFSNISDHLSLNACFLHLLPQANCTRSALLLQIFLSGWFTLKHGDVSGVTLHRWLPRIPAVLTGRIRLSGLVSATVPSGTRLASSEDPFLGQLMSTWRLGFKRVQ